MFDVMLTATWVKLSVKVEFWVGVGILVAAILGVLYKLIIGEWTIEEFLKGD
jgi:hypothetical protein